MKSEFSWPLLLRWRCSNLEYSNLIEIKMHLNNSSVATILFLSFQCNLNVNYFINFGRVFEVLLLKLLNLNSSYISYVICSIQLSTYVLKASVVRIFGVCPLQHRMKYKVSNDNCQVLSSVLFIWLCFHLFLPLSEFGPCCSSDLLVSSVAPHLLHLWLPCSKNKITSCERVTMQLASVMIVYNA